MRKEPENKPKGLRRKLVGLLNGNIERSTRRKWKNFGRGLAQFIGFLISLASSLLGFAMDGHVWWFLIPVATVLCYVVADEVRKFHRELQGINQRLEYLAVLATMQLEGSRRPDLEDLTALKKLYVGEDALVDV